MNNSNCLIIEQTLTMEIKELCQTFLLVTELKTYERTFVGRTSEYPLFDRYLAEKLNG